MSQYIQTVALNDVRCFARHGWYPEEKLTGGVFFVDVTVKFPFNNAAAEQLDKTVNYEVLNNFILEEMANPRKLLETVVECILERIIVCYPFISEAEVTIRKMRPPMKGEIGNSLVRLSYSA